MTEEIFEFLKELRVNNNREWFNEQKPRFDRLRLVMDDFLLSIQKELDFFDEFDAYKNYRIYRDVRFSKDKTPYKQHFAGAFRRKQPYNRGTFYLHIEPGNSFVGGGFWNPDKADLQRIRQAIDIEDDLEVILNNPKLKKELGGLFGESLKTVPKGFEKDHPRIELLKFKQFIMRKTFTDDEVLNPGFKTQVVETYKVFQPFFQYMTEVLTTDENGESIL